MLRIIQRIVLCASLFILLVLAPNPLWACSMSCPPLDEFKLALPTEKLESYDAVFLGMLVEKAERLQDEPCREKEFWLLNDVEQRAYTTETLDKCFGELSPRINDYIYTFEIKKAWKGVDGKTVSLFKIIDSVCRGMTCGTPNMVLDDYPRQFVLAKRYLVYAHRFESDNRLYPRWRDTKPAELAQVEMMFLNAAEKNSSVASVVKQLPEIFHSHSSPVTRAETIKWLRHAPPQISTEDRKKFFIEALISTDENLRIMKTQPVEGKDFEGLPGSQEYLDEDNTTILTAVALALGNEEFKGDRDVIHVLIYLLKGVEPRVNIAAAQSLKKLGLKDKEMDKRIYEVLKYGLNHTDIPIRNLASTALIEIKTPEARIISIENMIKRTNDDSVKKSYEESLKRIKKSLSRGSE